MNEDGTYSDRVPIDSFLTELAVAHAGSSTSRSRRASRSLRRSRKAVEEGTPVIQLHRETVLRGQHRGARCRGAAAGAGDQAGG